LKPAVLGRNPAEDQSCEGRGSFLGVSEEMTMTAKFGARAFALALALPLATSSATWAAEQTITLRLGAGSALALERPFKTVLIGDPNVVNVEARSDRSVVLEPLNPGATNLVFIDDAGIAIANIRILVHSAGAIPIGCRAGSDDE
jgi:Flp pilus assembly secretin CpaC